MSKNVNNDVSKDPPITHEKKICSIHLDGIKHEQRPLFVGCYSLLLKMIEFSIF